MNEKITVRLSDPIAAKVKRIAETLTLSLDQCVEYLLETFIDGFADGDTRRLVDLAVCRHYPTREAAQAVAERLEQLAVQNHLDDPEREKLISVEVTREDRAWALQISELRVDKWKGIDERESPTFQ
jgi:Trk K+ transport system NAD-binding subunit